MLTLEENHTFINKSNGLLLLDKNVFGCDVFYGVVSVVSFYCKSKQWNKNIPWTLREATGVVTARHTEKRDVIFVNEEIRL